MIPFLLIGCSQNSGNVPFTDEHADNENHTPCISGFLCESDSNPENIALEEVSSKHTVDSDTNIELNAGEGIEARIAPNSFAEETDIQIIHGIDIDNLGYTQSGKSNETMIGNAPEMIMFFDVVELVFERAKLAGSIQICMDYGSSTLQALNEGLAREYPGIFTLTENDVGLYFFDKGRGEFIPCRYTIDSASKKFIVNTQLPGIYVVALKPEIFNKMKAYFDAHPQAGASFVMPSTPANAIYDTASLDKTNRYSEADSYTSSNPPCETCARKSFTGSLTRNISSSGGLSPEGYAPEPPGEVDEWGEWGETNCSAPHYISLLGIEIPVFLDEIIYNAFGDRPFYYHDFCYRYGRGTYNCGRKTCDDIMLSDICHRIDSRYGWNGPKGWRVNLGFKKIWVPNPAYLAWKTATWPVMQYLYSIAGAVYAAVRYHPEAIAAYMDNSSASKISGCFDYYHKGLPCEIARIHQIITNPDNRAFSVQESISFKAQIFANQDSKGILKAKLGPGYSSRHLDRIEWSLTPYATGFSVLQSSATPSTEWTIPADITPGDYVVKADLFDNFGLISSKSVNIKVISQNGSVTTSIVQGGAYPDYATSAAKDAEGNLYISHCITGSKKVFIRNERICIPNICYGSGPFGVSYPYPCGSSCFTIPIYEDVPTRTGRVSKFNAAKNQLWTLDFPDTIIRDIALSPSCLYAFSSDANLIKITTNGSIAEKKNIALTGMSPFKILADQWGYVYAVYTKQNYGFTINKFNESGTIVSTHAGMAGGTVSDAKLAYNAVYVQGNYPGKISVEKYDLNLTPLWSYAETLSGPAACGNIDILPDSSAYITGMAPSSVIFGSGSDNAYFVSKLDPFGNMVWRKGMNGATPSAFPTTSNYYLAMPTVLPVVRAGTDSKAYILSSPGLSIRTVSAEGDFEKMRSIPVYSGNVYFQNMFIAPSGTMSIYGSTDGKITPSNGTFGMLDLFYLETENY